MKNIKPILSYECGDKHIFLMEEDGVTSAPPSMKKYSLRHNFGSNEVVKALPLIEGVVLFTSLLSEQVESELSKGDVYPYSREQFLSLVNLQAQQDPTLLLDTLQTSITKENKILGF